MADLNKLLMDWDKAKQLLEQIKERENLLRKEIFALAFPTPKEGSNTLDIGNGYKLVGEYKINRTLDIAAFDQARESMVDLGIDPRELVKFTPELIIGPYKKLNPDQMKLVDFCITSKPGLPGLSIKPPSEPKKK